MDGAHHQKGHGGQQNHCQHDPNQLGPRNQLLQSGVLVHLGAQLGFLRNLHFVELGNHHTQQAVILAGTEQRLGGVEALLLARLVLGVHKYPPLSHRLQVASHVIHLLGIACYLRLHPRGNHIGILAHRGNSRDCGFIPGDYVGPADYSYPAHIGDEVFQIVQYPVGFDDLIPCCLRAHLRPIGHSRAANHHECRQAEGQEQLSPNGQSHLHFPLFE
jgi:hypothetical protein